MGQLPDIYTGVAFNAEPFDVSAVPVWADLSSRYEGTSSASRGRSQYELSQAQTGTADMTWLDPDEALNPQNPSSPYWPLVVPYRSLLWRGMYPAGGTGNLIAGSATGADGSFESYTTLAQMQAFFSFLYGASSSPVTFALSSGSAWQGTKAASVQLNISSSNVVGGQFSINLIPGRQYTAQAHVNQTVAAKFQLAIGNMTIAVDAFNRTTANGWGTPTPGLNFGPAWTSVGTAANFLTSGGVAFHSLSAVNTRLTSLTGSNVQDSSSWGTVSVPVMATGASIVESLYARYTSVNDTYKADLSFGTGGFVTVSVSKVVAGVTTSLGSILLPDNYSPGDQFRAHFDVTGAVVSLKVWRIVPTISEPPQWTIQVTDNSISLPGQVGTSSILGGANTNTLPVAISWSDYRSLGSVVDIVNSVTAVSGSYQLIKQTFTATQPFHTIQLESQATPAANITVLIDGLQVEPGAVANTFITTGPILRSLWTRGFVERWPSQWDADSMGYLGIMSGPVVGPSAILSTTNLWTEYVGSVLAKQPRYYWRLNEPAGATQFSDQSGFNGTSLYRLNAIEGAAQTFAPGTAMGIAGDPNGVGVNIVADQNTFPSNATILLAGDSAVPGTRITGLGGTGPAWGLTVAFWMSSTANSSQLISDELFSITAGPLTARTAFFYMGNTYVGGTQGPYASFGVSGIASFRTPSPSGTNNFLDGKPHHFVGELNFTNDTMTLTSYVDGVLWGTNTVTVSTFFGSTTVPASFTGVSLAGEKNVNTSFSSLTMGIWGEYSGLSLYNRALSSTEIVDLYTAGLGYPNENSGTRIARYLSLVGYANPNMGIADIGQGQTNMGPSTLAENTAALTAIQAVQDTEFGNFYEAQDGIAFRGRQARYLTITPSYIFGENASGGEYPYSGAPIYDLDPTYVYTSAAITRSGGIIAYATDVTGKSQLRYGNGRQFTRTINSNNDNEAQDAAVYVVANSKDARARVEAVTLDPGAVRGLSATPDGTMWPMVLTLEPGMRVTQKRRAKAANAGAGLTMSADYFIEGITPQNIVFEQGTYGVLILMSPVPPASAGGQPWILENSVYGVLDSTTILGF